MTIELSASTLTAWPAWLIAGLSAVGALAFRLNAAWLVMDDAVLGWLLLPWSG